MTLEDAVHHLNTFITHIRNKQRIEERGYLVLHRKITDTPIAFTGAVKKYQLDLIYVNKKEEHIIGTALHVDRAVTDPQQERIMYEVEKKMMSIIYNLIYERKALEKIIKNDCSSH